MRHLIFAILFLSANCYGAVTVTRSALLNVQGTFKHGEKVTFAWTSDASGNASTSVELRGYLVKAVTDPGATAPTDNYDVQLFDPSDSAFDALSAALANRDTANTEMVPAANAGTEFITYLYGTYTFDITNAGDSKVGEAEFYILNP